MSRWLAMRAAASRARNLSTVYNPGEKVRNSVKRGTAELFVRAIATLAITFASWPSIANETQTYSYDARGRLVKVSHTGTVNNGNNACYAYDRADNRDNVTV